MVQCGILDSITLSFSIFIFDELKVDRLLTIKKSKIDLNKVNALHHYNINYFMYVKVIE
jgi:hypothetical protein